MTSFEYTIKRTKLRIQIFVIISVITSKLSIIICFDKRLDVTGV